MISSLAWPAALVVVSIVFMLIFRSEVASLLGRTKKIDKEGIKTFEKTQTQKSEEEEEALDEFMESYDNPLLTEQESRIEEELSQVGLEEPEDARSALVRELAATQISLFFERVQSNIFRSQLNMLTYLNSLPESSSTTEDIRQFFDQAKEEHPDFYSNYSFEQWLEFMKSRELVQVEEDSIVITVKGHEFLKWRIETGQTGPSFG